MKLAYVRARPILALLALSFCLCTPQKTHAESAQVAYDEDASKPLMPVRLDAHASLTWNGYFGLGGRIDIPIMEKGLAYSTRDQLSVSLGADIIFLSFESRDEPLEIWPTGTVQWSLGVTERFTFYPELGLTAKIERERWGGVFPNVGFGGRYSLYRSISLLGRVGWPMAISLGGTF